MDWRGCPRHTEGVDCVLGLLQEGHALGTLAAQRHEADEVQLLPGSGDCEHPRANALVASFPELAPEAAGESARGVRGKTEGAEKEPTESRGQRIARKRAYEEPIAPMDQSERTF